MNGTGPSDSPRVVDLSEVDGLDRTLIGGKAAGLALMADLGLPVPPGFVVTTEVGREVLATGAVPDPVRDEVEVALARLEARTGRRFGDRTDPLLVSVRSGGPESLPGMMDTILDVGIDETVRDGLAARADPEFAAACHRRLLAGFRAVTGTDAPGAPRAQLHGAIAAVFASWNSPRAVTYRDLHGIDHGPGTAVVVQAMVFGDLDESSGSGVAFSRDPRTGRPGVCGDYLPHSQGDDVVAGGHAVLPLAELAERAPAVWDDLEAAVAAIEGRLRDLADVEFTVEGGRLHLLQCRVGTRAAPAAVRIAVDLVDEGVLRTDEAADRVTGAQRALTTRPSVDPLAAPPAIAVGLGACPGVASGTVCHSPERAIELAADGPVILVRPETSPSDVPAMAVAAGLLTSRGGLVSHAAIVARELDLPAVVGAGDVDVGEGEIVTIDGATGSIYRGAVPVLDRVADAYLERLAAWAP